jgi:hypothetical protein
MPLFPIPDTFPQADKLTDKDQCNFIGKSAQNLIIFGEQLGFSLQYFVQSVFSLSTLI